jgi:hypothetical protein
MVSGTMAITKATLVAGSGAIGAQRGNETWGANYTFSPSGLQNDIYQVAEVLKDNASSLVPATSGTYTIGTSDAPVAASGIIMNGAGNVPFYLVINADGSVSGVAV